MISATLLRFADSPFGVFGWLDLFDAAGTRVARFPVAEDDWLDNAPSISCIATGTYTCRRILSPSKGETFEITGVPGRSRILFHEGNTEEDTAGCILLGSDFGALVVTDEDAPAVPGLAKGTKWGVTRSKAARSWFMALLKNVSEFPLEVRWATPGEWRAAPPSATAVA